MEKLHELIAKKKKINVLILCGGRGLRINKLTKNIPKPLIKTFNKPFLYYLIKNLTRYNFNNFYLLTYYKSKKFEKFKNTYKKKINANIKIISEKNKLDTGGAVIHAIKKIKNDKDYLLINGDTYFDIDYNLLYDQFINLNSFLMPLVKASSESKKLNSMNIDRRKRIIFSKKKGYMNSGVYMFKKQHIHKYINHEVCSFENLILNQKIKSKEVYGQIYKNKFIDIGSYKKLENLNSFVLNNYYKKKILFLDRDNTLIKDKGYTYKIKDLKIIKKNIDAIKKRYQEYLKIIITNQSGIGRGFYSINQFALFMSKLQKKLNLNKIFVSKIYFCPHHIESKMLPFKTDCFFRKPKIGMIKKCFDDFDIKKNKNCIIIGNDLNDKNLGKNSGIKYIDQATL